MPAKTPALTIYNTLESQPPPPNPQSPTLSSYGVGSASFSHVPLSSSSPLGPAMLVTNLLLRNRLNDSIDPQWNLLLSAIQSPALLPACVF